MLQRAKVAGPGARQIAQSRAAAYPLHHFVVPLPLRGRTAVYPFTQ